MPLQARAHFTVDAVIAATSQILLIEGSDACTTKRIARFAGVGIGSLYQYIPDEEALVIAVMEQHLTRMRESLDAQLAEMGDACHPSLFHGSADSSRLQPAL